MKNTFFKYFILCIISIILTETSKYFLQFDKLLYNSLAENLTSDQIENIFNLQKKWQWVSYLFVPIFILFKICIISTFIYIGIFFFSINDITFKNIWNSVINSEFVFLLVPVLKIIWFYFFQTNFTLEDIQYFYPLSALTIFDYKELEPWLIYPLQTLNVFELVYIIILSYQIGTLTKTNADTGLKIVGSSYIPSLLLWVTIVMFFTLNFS